MGGVKRVQEFQKQGYSKPWDPFRTGIWYLSNLIREDFLWVSSSIDVSESLLDIGSNLGILQTRVHGRSHR